MTHRMVCVGVAGGSGSGKTTVCNQLVAQLDDAIVLSCDSYYRSQAGLSSEAKSRINYDHPDCVDFELLRYHLLRLKNGKFVDVPHYDFSEHIRLPKTTTLQPPATLLVEGILLFDAGDLRELFDLRLFVDASADIRLQRRVRRDVAERGRTEQSVRQQWDSTVQPMFEQFVAPTQRQCHLTIHTDGDAWRGVHCVAAGINALHAEAAK